MPAHGIRTVLFTVVAAALCSSQAAAICSDSVVDPTEECDDGNLTPGDGCFSTCQFEDEFVLGGVGTGGPGAVKVWIFNIISAVPGTEGQSPNSVLMELAAEINATATLTGLGVSAVVIGNRLVTNGTITAVDVKDPGLEECGGVSVPVLPGWGLGLVALGLGLTGAALQRRRAALTCCIVLWVLTIAPTVPAQECIPHSPPPTPGLGVPLAFNFNEDSRISEVFVLMNQAFLRPWVADEFALDIEITSVNGGFHFHGTDIVPLSAGTVSNPSGGIADLSVPWSADNESMDINDVYTACVQLVLGVLPVGPEICGDFGPF